MVATGGVALVAPGSQASLSLIAASPLLVSTLLQTRSHTHSPSSCPSTHRCRSCKTRSLWQDVRGKVVNEERHRGRPLTRFLFSHFGIWVQLSLVRFDEKIWRVRTGHYYSNTTQQKLVHKSTHTHKQRIFVFSWINLNKPLNWGIIRVHVNFTLSIYNCWSLIRPIFEWWNEIFFNCNQNYDFKWQIIVFKIR